MERLNMQLEPSTKEETLRAMCSLAGNNAHIVVPCCSTGPSLGIGTSPMAQAHVLQPSKPSCAPAQAHDKNHCTEMLSL